MSTKKHILKFIMRSLLFSLATFFMYAILLCLWGDLMPEKFKKNLLYKTGKGGMVFSRFKEAETFGDTDIIFLGSSHTYRGFDTRIFEKFGFRSFNLGSSSQTPVQTLVLLNRYLDLLNPETVIYEVYPGTFAGDGVESALDIIANDKNDWESLKMAFRINHLKVYNSLIYGFYRNLTHRNETIIEDRGFGNDIYISGGYLQSDLRYWKPIEQAEKDLTMKDLQANCFLKICEIIKDKNIKLILVEAPVSSEYYKAYKNKKQVEEFLSAQAPYYDFNKILNLNDSLHFYDAHHLNQSGVEIFNKALITQVLLNP